jgi:hypothetical protein
MLSFSPDQGLKPNRNLTFNRLIMKKMRQICALMLLAFLSQGVTATAIHPKPESNYATGGYFDVYLKNNCGKEIEVRVRADGSSSTSKYKVGEKTKVPVKAGYEVYVDGKLFMAFSDSDSGKEINLCK